MRTVSGREERVARNESTSREINERLEEAHDRDSPGAYIRMVCECGQDACDRMIAITTAEYERIRSDPRQFAVMRDHVLPDMERVVSETEVGGRVAIVPAIRGSAWITSISQIIVDPTDPFPEGYLLTDTWPGDDQQG